MIARNIRRSANNTTNILFHENSFKACTDDRTSDLSSLFTTIKAQLYIITETKLTEDTAIKFNLNYLGKLWKHSVTTDNNADAGISIAYDPLMGICDLLPLPPVIQNRTNAVRFTPPKAKDFTIMGIYAPASGNTAFKTVF